MAIAVDFGPTETQALTIRMASNGVTVMDDRRFTQDTITLNEVAVFNDPREFAAWCEAWMASKLKR